MKTRVFKVQLLDGDRVISRASVRAKDWYESREKATKLWSEGPHGMVAWPSDPLSRDICSAPAR